MKSSGPFWCREKLGKKKEVKGYFEGVDVVSERYTWLDVSDCFGVFFTSLDFCWRFLCEFIFGQTTKRLEDFFFSVVTTVDGWGIIRGHVTAHMNIIKSNLLKNLCSNFLLFLYI